MAHAAPISYPRRLVDPHVYAALPPGVLSSDLRVVAVPVVPDNTVPKLVRCAGNVTHEEVVLPIGEGNSAESRIVCVFPEGVGGDLHDSFTFRVSFTAG